MRRLPSSLSLPCLLFLLFLASFAAQAQKAANLAELFQELQSPDRTDSAMQHFLKLKSDPAAKKYLIDHIPDMIRRGPSASRQAWNNAVALAGEFKIEEAASALAPWVGLNAGSGTITLGERARLADDSPAKALAEIGDPSVPSLGTVLAQGNLTQRWNAFYALSLIGSSRAKQALRDHVRQEQDPNLRKAIENNLKG